VYTPGALGSGDPIDGGSVNDSSLSQFTLDLRVHLQGARYYGSLPDAKDEREAVALEHAERLKVYRGEWRPGPDVTRFGDFIDRVYMPYSRAHKESWPTDEYRCEELKKRFGHFPLAQITPKMLADYAEAQLRKKSRRGKTYSPTTVKKLMHLCSGILQMALDERLVDFNAARSLSKGVRKRLKEPPRRQRFLSLAEEAVLFEALSGRREHLKPLTRAALLTGMRKGELLAVRRKHVNLGAKPVTFRVATGETKTTPPFLLFIPKSKNGLARVIPLSKRAQELFRLLLSSCGAYVFSSPWSDGPLAQIKNGFADAVEDAKLGDFHFHDLRHKFATRAADAGALSVAIRDILGHKPKNMTEGYPHATPEAMVAAVELVAAYDCTERNYGRITAQVAAG
jgi:integrase